MCKVKCLCLHSDGDVTNIGFTGCVKGVQFGTAGRDLNDYKEAKDILPGCPDIVRIVSFERDVPNSYIAMEPVSIDEDFEMTFKIKGKEDSGLLFYAADSTQEQVRFVQTYLYFILW